MVTSFLFIGPVGVGALWSNKLDESHVFLVEMTDIVEFNYCETFSSNQ